MKKSALILVVSLLLSCKTNPKMQSPLIYDNNLEVLNARVKQITEVTKKRYNADTAVTDFDAHGNITQRTSKAGCDCLVKYIYKYGKNGNPIEATRQHGLLPVICKYDKNGRITEISQDTKEVKDNPNHIPNKDHFFYNLKQDKCFFKYNVAGYLTRADRYLDTEYKHREHYIYDNKRHVVETDWFLSSGYLQEKKTYKYQAFDQKGNWLKRTAAIIIDNEPFEIDTIERKISYYLP